MPWNVDTISQSGFTKTVINTKPKADPKALTDEEKAEKLQQFSKANEGLMKQFGLLRKYQDSRKFLLVSDFRLGTCAPDSTPESIFSGTSSPRL